MLSLCETKNKLAVFSLHPRNHTQVYNKLKQVLTKEQSTFFARPDVFNEITQWSADIPKESASNTQVLNYEQLSDNDKDTIADIIEHQKEAIGSQLFTIPEFKSLVAEFFQVPSSSDIKVINENGHLYPVLTQWACRSNDNSSSADPLSMIIRRPRAGTAPVMIQAVYSDGSAAAGKYIYISYLNRESEEITDTEGKYDRGRCKIGSVLTVSEMHNGNRKSVQQLTVREHGDYTVVFPIWVNGTVKAVDQKNEIVPFTEFQLDYNGNSSLESTGEEGVFDLIDIEVGKTITFTEKNYPGNVVSYTIEKDNTDFIFHITVPVFTNGTVKVLDQNDEIRYHHPVRIIYNGEENEYNTGASGVIQLDNIEVGRPLRVQDSLMPDISLEAIVEDGANDLVLRTNKHIPVFVKVKLVDRKKKPMTGVAMDFTYNGKTRNEKTDDEGFCILPHESFVDGEKVKLNIHLPKKKKPKTNTP